MLYAVVGQVEHETTDARGATWKGSKGVGLFYVEAQSEEGAKRRGADIMNPLGSSAGGRVVAVHVDVHPAHSETVERFLADARKA